MKPIANNEAIEWFAAENGRSVPQATLQASGRLCFGKVLKDELRGPLRIGLLEKEPVLVLCSAEEGGRMNSLGHMRMRKLAATLLQRKVTLPARFLFQQEGGVWYGRIDPIWTPPRRRPRRLRGEKAARLLDMYSYLIESVITQYAKSTPLEDKRSLATEEFLVAAAEYLPTCGDFSEYMRTRLRERLRRENHAYSDHSQFVRRSLDADMTGQASDPFTLYDCLAQTEDPLDAVDEREMREAFLRTLQPVEQKLCRMLSDGYRVEEISRRLQIPKDTLQTRCARLGRQWSAFTQQESVQRQP